MSRDFPADAGFLCDKAAMLKLRDNIKWTFCIYHRTRKYVSGQQRALSTFIEVKKPQVVEWVNVSRSGGFEKMRIQA
jgi:hypothetical protein